MFIRKFFRIFFLFSIRTASILGQAADQHTPENIQHLAIKATQFDQANQLDSAVYYYQMLSDLYFESNQIDEYLSTYTNIADMFVAKREFNLAIQWLDSAFSRAVPPFNNEIERLSYLEWYLFKAYAYEQLGDFIAAKLIYEEAKNTLILNQEDEDFYVGKFLYQPLGNIYTRLGEYEQAIRLLVKFKEISISEDENEAIAQAINDLTIIYKILNQRNLALSGYQEALALPGLSEATTGLIQSNLAGLYYELNLSKPALQTVNKAISAFEKHLIDNESDGKIQQYLGWTYNLMGQIYGELENYQQSAKSFQNALNLSFHAFGTKHRREIAKIYINIGNLYLAQQNPQAALDHFQEALRCVIVGFNPEESHAHPNQNQLYPENSIFEALDGKANAHKLFFDASGDYKELHHALENYKNIRAVELQLRKGLVEQSSKLLLTEESHIRSEKAMEVAYLLYDENKNEHLFAEAFEIVESNKAATLLESIKNLQLKDFANIPNWMLEQEQELKSERTMLQKEKHSFQLMKIQDSILIRQLESNLFNNEQNWQKLQVKIKDAHPNYYQLKNAWQREGDLMSIRSLLVDKNSGLLSYFVGNNAIYALFLTKTKNQFIRIDKDFPLESQVVELTNDFMSGRLSMSNPQEFQALSNNLYKQLVLPLNLTQKITNLVIIPDGVLGYLPFDLLVSNLEQGNYSTFDYLIKSFTISYGFSANVIYENYKKGSSSGDLNTFLGMAPIFKESDEFAYLPFSKYEVESIKELMGGEILIAEAATKKAFKKNAAAYEILHISTHAAVIDSLPLYSWISFSDQQFNSDDEYKLYLAELYALKLNAKLAVLSACETGSGEFARGEGIMSLARGFAYSGCQSILTTLWPVNDATTSTILTDFYRYLADGYNKDQALRMAKLAYLQSDDVDELGAHPFFWAAYIPIGNMDPIITNKKWMKWLWISIGIIFLCLTLLILIKKKARHD